MDHVVHIELLAKIKHEIRSHIFNLDYYTSK